MTSKARGGDAPFTLSKWYFDCVAPDGRVVIGYWASMAWRRLAFTWQNVVLYEEDGPPARRSSLITSPPPDVGVDGIRWHAPALDCTIDVKSRQHPIEERLLDDSTGVVEWRVEAPAAVVSVHMLGSPAVQGPGYAEHIRLTLPPWRLPIRELRWGRWLDAVPNRSVVWIDWRGESQRTWVFVDGKMAPSAVVTDESVSAGAVSVVLGERRTLEALSFSEIAATIPALHAVVPKSLLALRQSKWCSKGTFQEGNGVALNGQAIHEAVVFR
jgi:hypothetical protein